jgi:hypothetical protein
MRERAYKVGAVDPGEAWCGLSEFLLRPDADGPYQGECVDQSRKGKIVLLRAVTVEPSVLYRELENLVPSLHHLVLERYSLYPWLAREQGYSELLTSQCVGVVRYIAHRADLPVTQQDAKKNLKEGRARAAKSGFRMKDRALGSGRFRYRGPDFDLPGKPHRRDSSAHGVMWSSTNPSSPLLTSRQRTQ